MSDAASFETVAVWFQKAYDRCIHAGRKESALLWSDGLTHLRAMRAERDALAERADAAERAIAEHNAECERLCADGERCGYAPYKPRRCTNCPRDWQIDLATPSAPKGAA